MSRLVIPAPAGTGRELVLLRWGLIPFWSKDPAIGNQLINARAETAWEKPSFRNAFRRHRCLIPASGFYEWLRWERGKQPYFVRMRDGHPFAFEGLWDRWESPDEGAVETRTILTTTANDVLAPIHDRKPVIVLQTTMRHYAHLATEAAKEISNTSRGTFSGTRRDGMRTGCEQRPPPPRPRK